MSDWTWHYNPDAELVTAGLPVEVVVEVERLAEQLTALGHDAAAAGRGPAHGGGCALSTSSAAAASSCTSPPSGRA